MKPAPPQQIDPVRPPGYGIEYDVAQALENNLQAFDTGYESNVFCCHDFAKATDELLKMMRANGYLREGL